MQNFFCNFLSVYFFAEKWLYIRHAGLDKGFLSCCQTFHELRFCKFFRKEQNQRLWNVLAGECIKNQSRPRAEEQATGRARALAHVARAQRSKGGHRKWIDLWSILSDRSMMDVCTRIAIVLSQINNSLSYYGFALCRVRRIGDLKAGLYRKQGLQIKIDANRSN